MMEYQPPSPRSCFLSAITKKIVLQTGEENVLNLASSSRLKVQVNSSTTGLPWSRLPSVATTSRHAPLSPSADTKNPLCLIFYALRPGLNDSNIEQKDVLKGITGKEITHHLFFSGDMYRDPPHFA